MTNERYRDLGISDGIERMRRAETLRVCVRTSGAVVCLKNVDPFRRYGVKGEKLYGGVWGDTSQKTNPAKYCGLGEKTAT